MQKPVEYHFEVEAEVIGSAEWYERQTLGLGMDFLNEIHAALEQISSAPEAFGFLYADVRCHRIHRFPFSILYIDQPENVFIVAVMHLHRQPEYWKHRVEN